MDTNSSVAIVTGAAGNLGQAVTKKFIEEGYKVIGVTEPAHNETLDFSVNEKHSFQGLMINLIVLQHESQRKLW